MKKLLLASAVAALSVTAANAAPTVYGKAFLTVDATSVDVDTTNTVTNITASSKTNNRPGLNSNGSRIGFKGSQALTPNTDLLYQLEYGVTIDDVNDQTNPVYLDSNGNQVVTSNNAQFSARDTYLGLSNAKFGTVMAGRLTGIDDAVDFANVTAGGIVGGNGVLAPGGNRYNNAFAYASPKYNNIQLLAMYGLDEDASGREGYGIAGIYENGPLSAGASYLQLAGNPVQGSPLKNALRISGSYQLNPTIKLGALYQLADYKTNSDESALTVSGEMQTATPWLAYAQGDVVSNARGASNADDFRLAVGGKYAFNKATTGHVYGGIHKEERTDSNTNTKTETTSFGVGGGIEYKF